MSSCNIFMCLNVVNKILNLEYHIPLGRCPRAMPSGNMILLDE